VIHLGLGDARDDPFFEDVAGAMKDTAAGALRLAHRALEVHARNVAYDSLTWEEEMLDEAEAIVVDAHAGNNGEPPRNALQQVREATVHLTRAISALENDRMGVPGHLRDALSRLFVVFLLASELAP
jgi:hypothetical protein